MALTKQMVSGKLQPGKYGDGKRSRGLHLLVNKSGTKFWMQRITVDGKRRDLGLGAVDLISLEEARNKAIDNARDIYLNRGKLIPTFRSAAATYIREQVEPALTNARSIEAWRTSLRYVEAEIGDQRVDRITSPEIRDALDHVWRNKPTTGKRLRQRIGKIFDWCVASGYVSTSPADDALDTILPKVNATVQHRRALPHDQVGAAFRKIEDSEHYWGSRLCLQMLILSGARSREIRELLWSEIDLQAGILTIPASRMKTRIEHIIPLSKQARLVLYEAKQNGDDSDLVFPSQTGKIMSEVRLAELCADLALGCVPAGFRSSLRDWCGESQVPFEISEAILAHQEKSATVRAYARSTYLEQRKPIMEAWAEYISK